MKKYIIVILIFSSITANAVIATKCSFNDSIGNNPNKSILYGSQQSINLMLSKLDSSKIIPGHLGDTLTIELGDGTTVPNPNTDSIVFKCCISKVFSKIPANSDGTRTINFKMPKSFPVEKFYIYSAQQGRFNGPGNVGGVYGQFSSVGIESYSPAILVVKEINYYDLLGHRIQRPDGICIQETVYDSGYIRRKKIYKSESY